MAWIDLTEDLIANRVTAPELSALKTAAKGAGQSGAGILAAAISAVCREVRSYCPPSVNRGDGETIPDEAEHIALAVLRNRLFSRIPNLARQFYDDLRKSEYEDGVDWLKAWARGERHVVAPVTPSDSQAAVAFMKVVSVPRRRASRDQLAGL